MFSSADKVDLLRIQTRLPYYRFLFMATLRRTRSCQEPLDRKIDPHELCTKATASEADRRSIPLLW